MMAMLQVQTRCHKVIKKWQTQVDSPSSCGRSESVTDTEETLTLGDWDDWCDTNHAFNISILYPVYQTTQNCLFELT